MIPAYRCSLSGAHRSWTWALLLWFGLSWGAFAAAPSKGTPKPLNIVDRASCSSLCRCKQSTEVALRAVADMGYQWVDLSCVNWAPHVSVERLVKDFDAEADRVSGVLSSCRLGVSNLTFDAPDGADFEAYAGQYRAVVRLAARLKGHLVNVMAPGVKADRTEMVRRLKAMEGWAREAGIILTVETHTDQFTERPADARWLCEQVPGLGLTLDPSHYYAGPNQGASFTDLLPLVRGTGFRAGGMSWAEVQLGWGAGPIDFAAIVRQLEAVGYRGFYVAEYIEGFNQIDALQESRRFLEWARGLR